jgi:hypothetical protein
VKTIAPQLSGAMHCFIAFGRHDVADAVSRERWGSSQSERRQHGIEPADVTVTGAGTSSDPRQRTRVGGATQWQIHKHIYRSKADLEFIDVARAGNRRPGALVRSSALGR